MKTKILIIFMLFISFKSLSQVVIEDIDEENTFYNAPMGTYIKDTNNKFGPFLGTWKYQNGNEILIIKLEKVEMYFHSQYGTYEDFIKGNYSYSIDGGLTYIVNTIQQNLGNNNPDTNPIYSCGSNSPTQDEMVFRDVIYQKNIKALFTFQNNNFNQIHLKLKNVGRGYILPATPPNLAFCIPDDIILIKQ